MKEVESLIREYVREVLNEMGPVANDDGSGMVTFTRPTTDPDDVESEFHRHDFENLVRRELWADRSKSATAKKPTTKKMTRAISDRQKKITGKNVNRADMENELNIARDSEDEFDIVSPEEKTKYWADPKWYTKYF